MSKFIDGYDPAQGSSRGVTRPGGYNTTPYLHGRRCPDYGDVLDSQDYWRNFVETFKPYIMDALREATNLLKQDPSNERKEKWYLYCKKSLADFLQDVNRIESKNTYYNAADLKEAVLLMRHTYILDQEEFESMNGWNLRAVESAPTVVSSPVVEPYAIPMEWENWVKETKAIEDQLTDAIHKARDKKDRGHMLLLKEKLKKLQRYIEAKNLEISSAIQQADDERAQTLIFESLENLYADEYDAGTHDTTRVPVYRTPPTGHGSIISKRTDLGGSKLPVSRRAVDQMILTETANGPILQRSQYKIQAGSTEALFQMQSRTKLLGKIPQQRSISAMSVAEKQRQDRQNIEHRRQFVKRQEQIRLGQRSRGQSKLPLVQTESSKLKLAAPKSSRKVDPKTPAPMPQISAQDRLQKATKKKQIDSRMRADIASTKALNSVKKCMQDLRIPATAVASHSRQRLNRAETETETDVMSAMEGGRNQPITSTKDLAKKLQDLLIIAKKGKSLKSEQICEAVVREVDGIRSVLKPHPTTKQLGIQTPEASSKNWIDYCLKIYGDVEMANSVQLEQSRQAADNNNFQICSKKIEELARSKAEYKRVIREAARNNDIDKLKKLVWEAIGTLETSQYLCGDPNNDGRPNMSVEIKSPPKLRSEVAALARQGAPKRNIPSESKISVRRPQISSSKNTVPRPATTPSVSTTQRHQQPVNKKLQRQLTQQAQAKYPDLSKRSKSEASVCAIPVALRRTHSRRSESSVVSFQKPQASVLRQQEEAIRKARGNADRRKIVHSGSDSTESLAGPSRRPVSQGRQGEIHKPRCGIPTAIPSMKQEHIQMPKPPPLAQHQRLRSPGAVMSKANVSSLNADQREALAIRNKIARADLEKCQRLGAKRVLDANRAAATAQQFGSKGRSTKLPISQIKNTEITEEVKRRIRREQQEHMTVKKSTGTVKKQLYDMPQFREDQHRRGPTLPERNVEAKLPQIQPFVEPGKAYKKVLEQQALDHQVKDAKNLLGKASRIKSGIRAKQLHQKLAAVALPTERSIRNRPVVEVEHREIVQVKRQQIQGQQIQGQQIQGQQIQGQQIQGRQIQGRQIQGQQIQGQQIQGQQIMGQRRQSQPKQAQQIMGQRRQSQPNQAQQTQDQQRLGQKLTNSENLRMQAILKCHRLAQKRDSTPPTTPSTTPPTVKDPLTIKMDDLKKSWNDTKTKLLTDNSAAVEWANIMRSQKRNEISKRQYFENVRKQGEALKVVNEMEDMIMSAIQSGNIEQADDAVYTALERILQDEYVCIGDPNNLKDLQPGQRGYNRQELRKINYQIADEIDKSGFVRKCCVGMVRINGVLIPHGWIEPTKEQIHAKMTSLGNPNGEMDLQDMVTLLPLETQDQRVPKNAPGAVPYSRMFVNREIERPFPFMDFENDVIDSLDFLVDEVEYDSDAFSVKAKRVLTDPMRLTEYKHDRRRLNEFDNETIYEMMLVALAQRANKSIPTRDEEIELIKLRTNNVIQGAGTNSGTTNGPTAPASSTVTLVPGQNPQNGLETSGQSQQQTTVGVHYVHGFELTNRNWYQLRGSMEPDWFPGFYTAFPTDGQLMEYKSPSQVMLKAMNTMKLGMA